MSTGTALQAAAPFANLIPGVGPLISIGLSAAGGALANSEGARTSTAAPTIAPGYQSLADLLKSRAMSRLQQGTDLGGYTAGGVNNINNAFTNAGTNLNANLTARGLATSPVAGSALTHLATARAGSIADFMNTIPLLQRQMQSEDMSNGLAQVRGLGVGQTNVGAGSAVGSGLDSAAKMLAFLRGSGAITGGSGGSGNPSSLWPTYMPEADMG